MEPLHGTLEVNRLLRAAVPPSRSCSNACAEAGAMLPRRGSRWALPAPSRSRSPACGRVCADPATRGGRALRPKMLHSWTTIKLGRLEGTLLALEAHVKGLLA